MLDHYPLTANPNSPKENTLFTFKNSDGLYLGLVLQVHTMTDGYTFHNPSFAGFNVEKKVKNRHEVGAFYQTRLYIKVAWSGKTPEAKHNKLDNNNDLWYSWNTDGVWTIIM